MLLLIPPLSFFGYVGWYETLVHLSILLSYLLWQSTIKIAHNDVFHEHIRHRDRFPFCATSLATGHAPSLSYYFYRSAEIFTKPHPVILQTVFILLLPNSRLVSRLPPWVWGSMLEYWFDLFVCRPVHQRPAPIIIACIALLFLADQSYVCL